MTSAGYIFDDAEVEPELRRLRELESIFDPATEQLLLTTGDWTSRSCLEVGAGAGSIAAWMRARAGESGRVVAVDTNITFLAPLQSSVEVLQGDVRELPLGTAVFDVAHVRYVLVHNSDPASVLAPVIRALKPGGWLLVEEPDFTAAHGLAGPAGPCYALERVNAAMLRMFAARGMDPSLGRHVPKLLADRALELARIEREDHVARGGAAIARMMSLSAAQLAEKYIATGYATKEDVAGYREFAATPSAWAVYYATVRTLVRRPAAVF
jgi:ubiquinone/menaquinone biosynthesis C-methylase UbiE